jgi:hypothetical protein
MLTVMRMSKDLKLGVWNALRNVYDQTYELCMTTFICTENYKGDVWEKRF